MIVYRSLEEVPAADGRAVALGTFDGVHLGHRKVIGTAIERAKQNGLRSCVVTFDPHPAQVLRPDLPLKLLSTTAVREKRIEELGADELVAIPFTTEFSQLSADQFCSEVLVGTLGARHVDVGANFHFGHRAAGNAEMLAAHTEFDTEVVGLVHHDGAPVSSTRIRGLVERGEMAEAGELLGAPFTFEGPVIHGDARGRTLDMPTANIEPPAGMAVPGVGVYAAIAETDGGRHPSAVNVGVRPTFEDDGRLLVEAHLIDFDGNLYGKTLRLLFLEKLRDERKFDSAGDLVVQMNRDVAEARRLVEGAAAL